MALPALGPYLGLAGVDSNENATARLWSRRLEWPMLFLALWMLISFYLSFEEKINPSLHRATDIFVWCFFLVETLLLTYLVDDPKRYLRTNWMNPLILILGISVLWGDSSFASFLRFLRVVLIVGLLLPMGSTVRAILAQNNLGTTLLISSLFIGLAGTLISFIDPAIDTPWDGIWWALVTVTTVGYGDVVPSSVAGKVFAGVLILLGISLFSLLTASFSVFFLAKEEEAVIDKETELLGRIDQMENRLGRLEDNISRMLEYQRALMQQMEKAQQAEIEGKTVEKTVDKSTDQPN